MKVTVRDIGEVSVVDLNGRITIGEGDVLLREKVNELLGGHPYERALLRPPAPPTKVRPIAVRHGSHVTTETSVHQGCQI